MEHIKRAIFETIEKYAKIAESKGHTFPKVPIDFSLKGTCAGQAVYARGGKPVKMRFNLALAERHLDAFLSSTVPHEMAHVLQFMANSRSKPHGSEWDHFCKVLTGSTLPRCHRYNTAGIKRTRNVKKYYYECSCRTFKLSSIKHNRVVRGESEFRCPKCEGKLRFVQFITPTMGFR
jgi:SprT protein